MANRTAYKCDIRISYMLDGTEYPLANAAVKYIIIESLYETRYMPIIYVSLSVSDDMYTRMLNNEEAGKIYLNVRKYNINSTTSIYKDFIKGQFSYIMPTSNPNYSEELNSDDPTMDQSYKTLTLALMSLDLLNSAKSSFNGIYTDIDQHTLIAKTLDGLKTVVQMPTYNNTIDTIIIPPMTKIKLMDYIFVRHPFYDTGYTFFLDFDKSYLIEQSGQPIDAKDGQLNTVIIDINSVKDTTSYSEGVVEKNDAYQFYVNPANTNILKNKAIDKVTNQMVFINEDGVDYVDLELNENMTTALKRTFKRDDNPNLYKNMVESNITILELVKENMDGSIITPNKRYILNNYEGHNEYKGTYFLSYKKEIITNVNNEFGFSLSMGIKKVNDVIPLGNDSGEQATVRSEAAKSKSSSSSSSTTTTTRSTTTLKANNVISLNSIKQSYANENSQSLKRKIRKISEGK